jgi:hypothetical protein
MNHARRYFGNVLRSIRAFWSICISDEFGSSWIVMGGHAKVPFIPRYFF